MSRKFSGEFVAVRGPLAVHAEGFVAVLEGRGCAPRTIETQLRMLRDLSGWLEDRGIDLEASGSEVFGDYAAHRRGRTPTLRSPPGLVPLVGFLREGGAIPAAVRVVPVGGVHGVLAAFGLALVSVRGVSPATVCSYCSQVRPLFEGCTDGWVGADTAWRSLRGVSHAIRIQSMAAVFDVCITRHATVLSNAHVWPGIMARMHCRRDVPHVPGSWRAARQPR